VPTRVEAKIAGHTTIALEVQFGPAGMLRMLLVERMRGGLASGLLVATNPGPARSTQ
jgi:hypothetical protein